MRALVLALAAAALPLAGCGGDPPRGVQVTEATDDARLPARPRQSLASDTVYADSGRFVDPRLDSLRRDSLRADSLLVLGDGARDAPPAEAAPQAPGFQTFWPRFRDAVRAGAEPTAAMARFSGALRREDFATTFESAFGAPFRGPVLALTPRDFRRDGTAREVTVTVGYDARGEVVPEDEAETESSVTLRFDVVDGAYRLVSVALVGGAGGRGA